MISLPQKNYFGKLNHAPLGNLRLAALDLGLAAVEWADSQPRLDVYQPRLKKKL